MSLITNNKLQTVLDKLTRYAATVVGDTAFDPTFNAGFALGGDELPNRGVAGSRRKSTR
jgi:hypothetical protein